MLDALTSEEAHILRHTLTGGTIEVYRNLFVTGEGSSDFPICEKLASRGLMRKFKTSITREDDHCFRATQRGAEAVGLALPD